MVGSLQIIFCRSENEPLEYLTPPTELDLAVHSARQAVSSNLDKAAVETLFAFRDSTPKRYRFWVPKQD
jgi:hypothetical protein